MLTHHFTIIKFFCKKQKKTHFRARRASNMVDQLPASSNFPHIVFLILNENLIPTYQYSSRIFVFKIAKTFTIFSCFNKILQNHSKSVKKTRAFLKKIYGLNKKTLECIFFARGEHSIPMSGGQHRRLTQRSTTARVRSLFFLAFSLKKYIKYRF